MTGNFNPRLVLLVLSGLVCIALAQEVNVPELGRLQGHIFKTTMLRRDVYRFTGIPYAEVPTGAKRYKPVGLYGRLTSGPDEVFQANTFKKNCPQADSLSPSSVGGHDVSAALMENKEVLMDNSTGLFFLGDEDCLGLNIFSPGLPADGAPLRPVVFFVHGGAFSFGAADTYTGARLLDREILLVTLNYRIGILGFLSFDTDEAPGNAALFDLLTGLQWVNKYISYFGGDPNRVTIMGQSAGSAAVTHLMISPLARGLFHGAIAMSGAAIAEWAIEPNPLPHSLRASQLAGCGQTDPSGNPDIPTIVDCMKQVPPASLVSAWQLYVREERAKGRLGFGVTSPVIQKAGAVKFIENDPIEVLHNSQQANVPLLAGTMKHDGTFVLGLVYRGFLEANNHLTDSQFLKTELVPTLLSALGVKDESFAIYTSLSDVYIGPALQTGDFNQMMSGLIDLHSVFFFKASTYRLMELHAKLQPNTYYYNFDFKGRRSLFAVLFAFNPPPIPGGVAHGDDLMYIFYLLYGLLGDDNTVSQRMLDHWSNFIKHGNPTPPGVKHTDGEDMLNWPAYSSYNPRYMVIDTELRVEESFPVSWVGAADELGPPKPLPPCAA